MIRESSGSPSKFQRIRKIPTSALVPQTLCTVLALVGLPALALHSLNIGDVQLCCFASQAGHKCPSPWLLCFLTSLYSGPHGTSLLRLVGGDQIYTQVLVMLWVRGRGLESWNTEELYV